MARLLAISLLIIVVYSWEEVKYILQKLVISLFKRQPNFERERKEAIRIDSSVGVLVVIATVPIGFVYLMFNIEGIWAKLIWIGIVLLGIAAAAIISEVLLRRAQYATPLVSLISLFSPVVAVMAESGNLPRKILAKVALLFSLPIFAGLLVRYVNRPTHESLLVGLDLLTLVLIGSLILRVTIELLEHYFKWYRLAKLFSYYRVALGIGLAIILLEG